MTDLKDVASEIALEAGEIVYRMKAAQGRKRYSWQPKKKRKRTQISARFLFPITGSSASGLMYHTGYAILSICRIT